MFSSNQLFFQKFFIFFTGGMKIALPAVSSFTLIRNCRRYLLVSISRLWSDKNLSVLYPFYSGIVIWSSKASVLRWQNVSHCRFFFYFPLFSYFFSDDKLTLLKGAIKYSVLVFMKLLQVCGNMLHETAKVFICIKACKVLYQGSNLI